MGAKLKILEELTGFLSEEEEKGPLPELWGVLYVEPAPGGERRQCANCVLWSPGTWVGDGYSEEAGHCAIHEKTLKVTSDQICGYHVFGNPQEKRLDFEGMTPVNPRYSGLGSHVGGVSCDTCKMYRPMEEEEGVCIATRYRGKPAPVHPRGCCARWEEKPKDGPIP
jgi:hypothetical protein